MGSYLNILINLKHDKGTLFALQLVQLQFKTCFISCGMRAGCLFSWSFYICATILSFIFFHIKDVVVVRWMSSDTMKLKREKLIQVR